MIHAATAAAPLAALTFEERHHRWLLEGDVRTAEGAVLSWANSARPGFAYAEAMGLLLSLHAEGLARGDAPAGRDRVHQDGACLAQALVAQIGPDGAVIHGGVRYAFDTAIVVAALRRWHRIRRSPRLAAAIHRGQAFLLACLRQGTGQFGAVRDGHWSREFGPHLLKLALALDDPAPVANLVGPLLDSCWSDDWFSCHGDTERIYPHAHAYALEGLAALRAWGHAVPTGVLERGVASLVAVAEQSPTDVIAQTLRLSSLGPRTDLGPAASLVGLLRSRATDAGGLRYRAGSDDRNSWVTVFGLQALRWQRIGADVQWLA